MVDLDYRSSDLLQSNCVIWVEGPSDRIYLKGLLQLQDADLREGTYYNILFYGGSNLAHLSGDDSKVDHLISVLQINRHSHFLCDSDKSGQKAPLKPAVKRIQQELAQKRVWITARREFENYLPREIRQAAFQKIHPCSGDYPPDGDSPYSDVTLKSNGENFDKVKMAQSCLERLQRVPDQLDLCQRVHSLAQAIRGYNGMPRRSARVACWADPTWRTSTTTAT